MLKDMDMKDMDKIWYVKCLYIRLSQTFHEMYISPHLYTINMQIFNQTYQAVIEIKLWTHGWTDRWTDTLPDSGHFNIPYRGQWGINICFKLAV